MPDPIPYLTNDQELTSIADAIRTRGGTSATLEYPTDFVSAIEAIPSGGDVNVETSKSYTVSASGAQTISPSMGYDAMAAVALSVSAGSAGTPSATKDIYVEEDTNIITAYITPSVTNTTGWITGGTKTGSAVTVEASELVSGTYTVDSSGTVDITNYENVSVPSGSATTPATTITANPSISVNSSTGLITATSSASQSVIPTVGAGYVSSGTAGTITVSGSNTSQLSTQAAATITPTESVQTAVAANKYTLGAVQVDAISSTYVGSDIDQNDSTDLIVSGATVTVPAGYYEENASVSVPSGTATAPASISGTSASVSTGTNTLTLSKTVSVTPRVSTAGYISSGTAGNSSVSLTASVPTQAAQTIHPSTSDQTISSGTYLTGAQTIKGVTLTNLSAANIVSGVTVKIGDSTDDDCVASVTGTASAGGYIDVTDTTDSHGGTIRSISTASGTPVIQTGKTYTVTENGTTTITPDTGMTAMSNLILTTNVASTGGYTLLASDEFMVNTTNTSETTVGTISCGSSAWTTSNFIMVTVRDKAGKRNGYFCSSWVLFANNWAYNDSASTDSVVIMPCTYISINSNGNGYIGSSTSGSAYGLYGGALYKNGDVKIRSRYSSSYSQTINGTYVCEVWALNYPPNFSPWGE